MPDPTELLELNIPHPMKLRVTPFDQPIELYETSHATSHMQFPMPDLIEFHVTPTTAK